MIKQNLDSIIRRASARLSRLLQSRWGQIVPISIDHSSLKPSHLTLAVLAPDEIIIRLRRNFRLVNVSAYLPEGIGHVDLAIVVSGWLDTSEECNDKGAVWSLDHEGVRALCDWADKNGVPTCLWHLSAAGLADETNLSIGRFTFLALPNSKDVEELALKIGRTVHFLPLPIDRQLDSPPKTAIGPRFDVLFEAFSKSDLLTSAELSPPVSLLVMIHGSPSPQVKPRGARVVLHGQGPCIAAAARRSAKIAIAPGHHGAARMSRLSAEAAAVSTLLPGEHGTSREKIDELVKYNLSNEEELARAAHLRYRAHWLNSDFESELRRIVDNSYASFESSSMPMVSIIISTNRVENFGNCIANYRRQNYTNKELIIVVNKDDFDLDDLYRNHLLTDDIKLYHAPDIVSLGSCLNTAVRASSGEFISKFDDDNIYYDNYISDLMIAFRYCDAAVVGKATYYTYLEGSDRTAIRFPELSHKYVRVLSGSAMITRRDVFDIVQFPDLNIGEDTVFFRNVDRLGYKIYSADPFNYINVRKSDVSKHTWKISQSEYIKSCVSLTSGLDELRVRL